MIRVLSLTDISLGVNMMLKTINIFDIGKEFVSSDEELVRKIQNGNKNLFEDLVERFSEKIFRYLFYYFNFSRDLAEDVVQDVFVKLWINLDKYDNKQKFEPWLYRFVHNYTIDWIRKHNKEQNVRQFSQMIKKSDDYCANFEENFVVDNSDIKKDVNKKLKFELIEDIVGKLEQKYREVIILFYFEEKSYEEISYILDISIDNVGTILFRAKQKIQKIVEKTPKLKSVLLFDI